MTSAPGSIERWVLAARIRTLPAAMVPVIIGTAVCRPLGINWLNAVLCLVVALSLQVGVNYANDYSDGIRGTDGERVGPFRLTASGLVPAKSVRSAAFACFFVAAVAGLALSSRTSWWFVAVGVSAIAAAWFYTGGPKPYGYYGFGELFVFLYFGLVATVGTAYAQDKTFFSTAWWLGAAMGFMACALLEANNLRDVAGDQLANKKTLAARLGRKRGSYLYAAWVVGAVGSIAPTGHFVCVGLALAFYTRPLRFAFSERTGRELLPLLKLSAQAQLKVGVVLLVALGFKIGY